MYEWFAPVALATFNSPAAQSLQSFLASLFTQYFLAAGRDLNSLWPFALVLHFRIQHFVVSFPLICTNCLHQVSLRAESSAMAPKSRSKKLSRSDLSLFFRFKQPSPVFSFPQQRRANGGKRSKGKGGRCQRRQRRQSSRRQAVAQERHWQGS